MPTAERNSPFFVKIYVSIMLLRKPNLEIFYISVLIKPFSLQIHEAGKISEPMNMWLQDFI
jgi:hypothetical protein